MAKRLIINLSSLNKQFCKIIGKTPKDLIGKKVTEVLPGIKNETADWIGQYSRVALEDKRIEFEQFSEVLNKWFLVNAYSSEKGFFCHNF